MAGMKYSPGFDDPPGRPRTKSKALVVAAAVIGAGVLGFTFMAYQSPSLIVDLSGVMIMCAEALGLR